MKKRYIWGPVVLLLIVVALIVWLSPRLDTGPDPRSTNLRAIFRALAEYSARNKTFLPYNEQGPEEALYLLKDVVSAKTFAIPDQADPAGPPRYDDATRRLEHCGYRYLNQPMKLATSGDEPPVCIMVERHDLVSKGVYVLMSDGAVLWVEDVAPPRDLLGQPWSVIYELTR